MQLDSELSKPLAEYISSIQHVAALCPSYQSHVKQ